MRATASGRILRTHSYCNIDLEDHSLPGLLLTVGADHEAAHPELYPHREPEVLVQVLIVQQFRLLLLHVVHGTLIHVRQLLTVPELVGDELLKGEKVGVGLLQRLAGVHQHRPHDVGEVALVPDPERAHDGPEVEVLFVQDDGELQLVVTSGLDDRGIAHLYARLVHIGVT